MADPIREIRAAEHMVMRLLLGELWQQFLLSGADPLGELKAISKYQLDALDGLAESEGGSDFFKQMALHEMETFWTGVRMGLERRSA